MCIWVYHNPVERVKHDPYCKVNHYYPLRGKPYLTSFAKEQTHRTMFCNPPIW